MAGPPDVSPLERFCTLRTDAGVEFIVVGGQAEVLMGGARMTLDVDLCYRRTTENLDRLAGVLRGLRVTLRGAPPDLRFMIDGRALALGQNFTFLVDDEHPLDLLGYLEPIGTYDDILPGASMIEIAGRAVRVIGLDDLIRIKQHLGRPKDRDSLRELEAIKRVREREGRR